MTVTWILRLVFLAAALAGLSGCGEEAEKTADGPPAEERTPAGETRSTASTSAGQAAGSLLSHVNAPWTGDYSGMAERRMVRVLLPYSKTFFFIDKGHGKGINYEFMTRFEAYINKGRKEVKGKPSRIDVVLIPTRRGQLLADLLAGRGDLALGNLTITKRRLGEADFSEPWLSGVKEFVVTPASAPDIKSVQDLAGRTVHVRKGSSYWESLVKLNGELEAAGKNPVEIVEANELLEDEDLLEMINADALPAIVMDSHKASFWSKVFDNIKVHESAPLRSGGQIAWAFRKNSPEFAAQVNGFITSVKADTRLGSVIFATYLKQQKWLKSVNNEADRKKFFALIETFQKYGERYGINWLVLAAKAYQESRLDNNAKGPRGAIGIMQIKPSTARSPAVGMTDISSIDDNIHAGTKYVRYLMDTYYDDLSHDRFNQTLIAFAGYNAGPERIVKLRRRAKEKGLDDTKWFNNLEWVVAESVGPVTVNYVRNIHQYFIIYNNLYEQRQEARKLKGE